MAGRETDPSEAVAKQISGSRLASGGVKSVAASRRRPLERRTRARFPEASRPQSFATASEGTFLDQASVNRVQRQRGMTGRCEPLTTAPYLCDSLSTKRAPTASRRSFGDEGEVRRRGRRTIATARMRSRRRSGRDRIRVRWRDRIRSRGRCETPAAGAPKVPHLPNQRGRRSAAVSRRSFSTVACVSEMRSSGASSISSPRRPALTKTVSKWVALSSR